MKKINLIIKWASLALIAATIIFLVLYLRKDNEWIYGFGKWTRQSVSGGQVSAGELQNRTIQALIAFLGGGALALAGTLLQKVTKNRLAEVSILGIGSINIMFIYLYVRMVGLKAFGTGALAVLMPILLIGFSILGTMLIWLISRSKRANKNTFVIVGIAIQLFAEALSVLIVNPSKVAKKDEEVWNRIKSYTLGNIKSDATSGNAIPWWLIIAGAVAIVVIIFVAWMLRRKIDSYETSEELAETSGVNTKRLKLTMFLLIAVLAGIASTIIGSIALLGIIAPSLARLLFKNKFAPLAIASFIIGGVLVALASWLSMNINWPVPVGILSTAIIIPYFIFLVIKEK